MTRSFRNGAEFRIQIREEPRNQLDPHLNPVQLKRHEWWRLRYMQDRYAQKLSEPELHQRARDIVINLLRLTTEAKVGIPAMDANGSRWMELLTHILEEIKQRRGFDAGLSQDMFAREPIPPFSGELARKAASALSARGLVPSQTFIKYGKREYMTRLFDEGLLRIQPASYFAHASHNGAIRDNELEREICVSLTRDDISQIAHNPEVLPKDSTHFRADISFKFETDYWLYCITRSVEPRLFVDFNADACVIIRDTKRFKERLQAAAREAAKGAAPREGAAVYVDPLMPVRGDLFVPLTKHFRYSYQEEHRFVWIPSTPAERLSHIDLELGSLDDICDLVLL